MRIRKAQPELDTAFKRGLKSRKGRTLGGRGRKSTQIYQKEKQPQSSQIELLPSEALAQFQEKIARDKARRLQQELKEIDL